MRHRVTSRTIHSELAWCLARDYLELIHTNSNSNTSLSFMHSNRSPLSSPGDSNEVLGTVKVISISKLVVRYNRSEESARKLNGSE